MNRSFAGNYMHTVTIRRALFVAALVGAVVLTAGTANAASRTRAQELRSGMKPSELKELRSEMVKMRSPNRWPQTQQDRYLKACTKAQKDEPSINHRVCECYLEVMMEKYATMGDFSKDLVNNGVQNDEKIAGLTGMCIAAFGD
jgi:uncharacterized protein YycO